MDVKYERDCIYCFSMSAWKEEKFRSESFLQLEVGGSGRSEECKLFTSLLWNALWFWVPAIQVLSSPHCFTMLLSVPIFVVGWEHKFHVERFEECEFDCSKGSTYWWNKRQTVLSETITLSGLKLSVVGCICENELCFCLQIIVENLYWGDFDPDSEFYLWLCYCFLARDVVKYEIV